MNRSHDFPRVSTIGSVYSPVERYLERLGDPKPGSRPIAPLDAYLVHLIFEFCPDRVPVVDLAYTATSGTASVICLASRNVSEVFAAVETGPHPARHARQRRLLGEAAGVCGVALDRALVPLEVGECPWHAARSVVEADDPSLFLIDPSYESIRLDRDLGAILEEFPRAMLLVLPVGRLGACDAVRELAMACGKDSPRQLWLLREASGALTSSGLALVARRGNPLAPQIVSRIKTLFSSNFDYLDLVREACTHAAERPDILRLEAEVARLTGEVARLSHESLQPRPPDLCEGTDSAVKAPVQRSGWSIVHLATVNRAWLAPQDGFLDRLARRVTASRNRVRGQAG